MKKKTRTFKETLKTAIHIKFVHLALLPGFSYLENVTRGEKIKSLVED